MATTKRSSPSLSIERVANGVIVTPRNISMGSMAPLNETLVFETFEQFQAHLANWWEATLIGLEGSK